jgi:hypothetical protein
MTHKPEQTMPITKCLIALAVANKLTHVKHDQYEKPLPRKQQDANYRCVLRGEEPLYKAEQLTQTELGYISTECFNYKLKYGELKEDLADLEAELKVLKGEKKKLVTQNREISAKTLFKITSILNENVSDKEKVIEIKKYLNV